jgi:hypothetical protein
MLSSELAGGSHEEPTWYAYAMQVSAKLAEPDADTEALMAKMDRLQTAIDACNGWELDRQVQRATDALRCPPGEHPYCFPDVLAGSCHGERQ